jgi:hypothetical protein
MSKYEIIYTDDYALIVSDEQIKDVRPYKGKFHLEKGYIINQFPTYLTDLSDCKLIIAHRPLTDAPILKDVPLLPEFTQEEDVSELSLKTYPFGNPERNAFITGYNKAKETYKYTEEDLRKAYFKGATDVHDKCTVRTWRGVEVNVDLEKLKECNKQFTQSLQQPKRPKYFECEIENAFLLKNRNGRNTMMAKPKTITNSQGQTELVGEYIF